LNQITASTETDKAVQFVITKIKANGSNGSELDATHNNTINFGANGTLTTTIDSDDTALVVSDDTAAGTIIKIGDEEMLVTTRTDATHVVVVRAINGTTAASHTATATITKVASVNTDKEFRVRKTVPTVALLALPSTTLGAGDKTIAKFTVTAGSNEDVNIRRINLNVAKSSSSVTLASGQLKVNGDVKSSGVTISADGLITFDNNEVVAAGTTKTFEVIMSVSGLVSGEYNYVNTKISEAGAYVTTSSAVGTSDFEWNDNSSNAFGDYFGSYRVIGVPTNTQQLDVNL